MPQSTPTLDLLESLIACPSITPDDANCQKIISDHLKKIDFQIENMPFGDVKNLWARRGNDGPLFVFLGHTDVVPPGPMDQWDSDPFKPEIRDGFLYGRGAADMKSGVSAFITACDRFIKEHPKHKGSIALLITSDEEAIAVDGTVKVIEELNNRDVKIDWCLVGEASSSKTLGDTVKVGRRGSLHGNLTLKGKQGHVAYPQNADNAIHKSAPILNDLIQSEWDKGNKHFPPTTFQIWDIKGGAGADNVIPGSSQVQFNFRYSTEVTAEALKKRVKSIIDKHTKDYELNWRHSGKPFLTQKGKLIDAVNDSIKSVTGITTELSTAGGTSDGRFVAPTGAEVVEVGPINATIHQVNECVNVSDLEKLSQIYQGILEKLLL